MYGVILVLKLLRISLYTIEVTIIQFHHKHGKKLCISYVFFRGAQTSNNFEKSTFTTNSHLY
jgi:hypothetical protein